TRINQLRAELLALEGSRNAKIVLVRIKHEGVEAALNTASNGDPQAAKAWVGKTKSQPRKMAAVSVMTNSPENPALRTIKRNPGAVEASCTKEPGATCYMFQMGNDPLHPETWPAPAIVKGYTHKVENLPIGQVICCRIAIVRRGSVQSQWSPVLQI